MYPLLTSIESGKRISEFFCTDHFIRVVILAIINRLNKTTQRNNEIN
jgi:hypothetical protein